MATWIAIAVGFAACVVGFVLLAIFLQWREDTKLRRLFRQYGKQLLKREKGWK